MFATSSLKHRILELHWPSRSRCTFEEEDCDPTTKIPFPEDQQIEIAALAPLAAAPLPPECEGFNVGTLINCVADLNVQEGCCDLSCQAVFFEVTPECLIVFGADLCQTPEFATFVPFLGNLARRCDDDPVEISCDGDSDTSESPTEPAEAPAETSESAELDEPAEPVESTGPTTEPDESAELEEPVEAPESDDLEESVELSAPEESPVAPDSVDLTEETQFTTMESSMEPIMEPGVELDDESMFELVDEPALEPESEELSSELDECQPEDKIPADESVDPNLFLTVAGKVPESCGSFTLLDLLDCQNDIDFVEGCCDASCVAVFEPVSNECLQDVVMVMCEDVPELAPVVANLARRCKEGFEPLTCEDLGFLPAAAPGPEGFEFDIIGMLEEMEVEEPEIETAAEPGAETGL